MLVAGVVLLSEKLDCWCGRYERLSVAVLGALGSELGCWGR